MKTHGTMSKSLKRHGQTSLNNFASVLRREFVFRDQSIQRLISPISEYLKLQLFFFSTVVRLLLLIFINLISLKTLLAGLR